MPVTARVQPVSRDFQLLLDDLKSPQAKSLAFAEFARAELNDAKAINRAALGYDPPLDIYVDGTKGAPLESVRNVVVGDFKLIDVLIMYIHSQLEMHSPVKTGKYKQSHMLLIDGREFKPITSPIPFADEYVFVNIVPYARKIERGSSSQAPDGVYQVVAHLAQQQFRNIGSVTFSYRTVLEGVIVGGKIGDRSEQRNPAIIVKAKL